MGLLELLFERRNPGKVGSIQKNKRPTKKVSIPILIIKLIISTLIVYGLFYITVLNYLSLKNVSIFITIIFLYCLISYKVIPRPDTSNVGLLGGLLDHPFRYSDDLNRMLIFLFILLFPGRFIATTIVQTIMLFKKNAK